MDGGRLNLDACPLDGLNLIEASAGTGKTYAMAGLYLRLVLERELPVERILVVTYTKAATGELRLRIRQRLRQALSVFEAGETPPDDFMAGLAARIDPDKAAGLLRRALADFDRAAIHTIHAFCHRVLTANAFETSHPFAVDMLADASGLVEEIARDWWRLRFLEAPERFLKYALSRIVPDRFLGLADHVLNHSRLALSSQAVEGMAEAEEAADDALSRVKKIWGESGEEIEELLVSAPGLDRRSYRRDHVARWCNDFCDMIALFDNAAEFASKETLTRFTITRLKEKTKEGKETPDHEFFTACEELRNRSGIVEILYEQHLKDIQYTYLEYLKQELTRRKARRNVQGYDDLLDSVHSALRGSTTRAALREQYDAGLIDEFQDTDPLQFAIFLSLFGEEPRTLFLIGDPKQAIYSFRGADIFAYMQARTTAKRRYHLEHNWRSLPELVRAVNHLFSGHENPFVFEDIPFSPVDSPQKEWDRLEVAGGNPAPLRIWWLPQPEDGEEKPLRKTALRDRLARATAGEIARLLDLASRGMATLGGEPLTPGDIAVLTRSHREADSVRAALEALGIPSVLSKTGSVFESPQAWELLRVMEGVSQWTSPAKVRSALATPFFGLDIAALDELSRDEATWESWLETLAGYHETWNRKGFVVCLTSLMREQEVRGRLLGRYGGERSLTNHLHLLELVHAAEREGGLGMSGLVSWLAARIANPEQANEEQELRLETDAKAVRLVTIHGAKGLEYPVVFCPFLYSNSRFRDDIVYHDPDHDHRLTIRLAPAPGDPEESRAIGLAERELMAENVRLAYVALTRARCRCYLAWGWINQAGSSALAWLFHGPPDRVILTAPGPDGAEVTEADIAARLRGAIDTVYSDNRDHGSVKNDLAARTGKCPHILMSPLPDDPATAPVLASGGPDGLAAAEFGRERLVARTSVTSFTAMTRGHHDPSAFAPSDPSLLQSLAETGDFLAFPRGTATGIMLHRFFETLDFQAGPEQVVDHARGVLEGFGFDPEWSPAVAAMARTVVAAELEPGVRLAEVGPDRRLDELVFHWTLKPCRPDDLASAYAAMGEESLNGFAARIEELDFRPSVRNGGYLTGSIDLVFESRGRFHILDWKSNFLGARHEDYGPGALDAAMAAHRYLLQSHLYLLALHRHLSLRLPDYDPGRHLGGIFYVFLRGVRHGVPGSGVHAQRPDPALLQGLCGLLLEEPQTLEIA